MKKKTNDVADNQNETDVILDLGQYMPRAVYINKYGEELNDAALGAIVRKNHERYMKSVAENAEKWQQEGESFKKARQALGMTQKEIAEGIGVSPITVGNYEKGKPVRSRKMLRRSGITVMELEQLKRNKELAEIKI